MSKLLQVPELYQATQGPQQPVATLQPVVQTESSSTEQMVDESMDQFKQLSLRQNDPIQAATASSKSLRFPLRPGKGSTGTRTIGVSKVCICFSTKVCFGSRLLENNGRLHGVSKENPLAPLIGRHGLPLYRARGDNSVLYDHDLERYAVFDKDGNQVSQELVSQVGETFESILEETNKVREEFSEDTSIGHAITIVFEINPKLKRS